MPTLLEDISNIGAVETGGPQPPQPSKSVLTKLSGIEAPEKGGRDVKSILENRPPPSRQEEAKALVDRFEQDKLRDSLLGINVGIAQFLDLPFEVSAMILRQIPGLKGVRGNPIGTLFKALGQTPESGQEPDSAEFEIGKVVGNSIATLPLAPLGAGIQTGAQFGKAGVTQALKGTAKQIGKTAVKAPTAFAGSEVIAATTAGIGIQAAKTNFPDSDYAQFIGGLVGGTAPALAPVRLTIQAGRAIKQKITNFRTKGKIRAAKEIENSALDLEAAGKSLDNPNLIAEANATAAQKTGDPGILALERSIIDRGHQSIYDSDNQIAQMNAAVNNSLRAPDSAIESTRATLESQKNYTQNLLDINLKMAARNAEDAVTKLGPSATSEQANVIARKEIEAVEALARTDEEQLWDVVPREVPVRASTATQLIRDLAQKELTSRTFKGRKNLPSDLDLEKFLGGIKIGKKKNRFFKGGLLTKKATMGELQDLRSDVLREMRKQRSELAPNKQTISILDDLQEALLQDMGASTGGAGTDAGDSLRLALTYSRQLNETFNRGIMAKLKGVDKLGTATIPEELTLVSAFGGKPEKAAENIRTIIKASKGVEGKIPPSPEMLGAMEDFIKNDFQRKVIRGGTINSFKAQQYMEKNLKILDEFPQIRDDIARAIKTEDVRAIRQRRTDMFTKNVLTSKAALFIEKSPRKMFESIEASRPEDFNREMNNILNKVKKDETGEALEGLQIGFFDWIRQRATTSSFDVKRQKIISGQALDDLVNNPKIAAMMGKLLDKGQIERLRAITNTAKAVEKARLAKPGDSDVLEAGESKFINTVMRIAGAKTGAGISKATGGGAGGLQTAAIMSERFKTMASGLSIRDPAAKLLTDAFADPSGELLKVLLLEIRTAKQLENVTARLHAWAASVAYQAGDKSLAENIEE